MKTKTFILTNPADYNVLKNLSLGQHVYLKKSESDGNQKIVVNTTLNNSKVEIGEFSSHRIDEFFEFIDDNSEGIITSIIDSSLDFHENKIDIEVSFEINTEWPYAIEIAYEERIDNHDPSLIKKYLYLNCADTDLEKIYNVMKSKFKIRYLIRATAPENKQNRFYTWLIAFDYSDSKYYLISNDFIYKLFDDNKIDYLIPLDEFKRKIQTEQHEIDNIKMSADSDEEKDKLSKKHIKELINKTCNSLLVHNESFKTLIKASKIEDVIGILYGLNYSFKHGTKMNNPPCKKQFTKDSCFFIEWEFSTGSGGGENDGRLYVCRNTSKVLIAFKKDYDIDDLATILKKLLG